MRRFHRVKAGILGAVLAVVPLGAMALTLDCAVKPGNLNKGWITDRYIFDLDEGSGAVTVMDGVINYFEKKPIEGVLVKRTDKQIVVAWQVLVLSNTQKRFKMDFRATYFVAEDRLDLFAKPPGFYETYGAPGRCRLG